MKNVFNIYADIDRVPFAVSRRNWSDHFLAIVTRVIPKGNYGVAYAFPVEGDTPNDHFSYDRRWRDEMIMPNAGSYQWRLIELEDDELLDFVEQFKATSSLQYNFHPAVFDPSLPFPEDEDTKA